MMSALSSIRQEGFEVCLSGAGFDITPANKLTTNQREFLKEHKSEIIKELKLAANDNHDPFDDQHYCRECRNLVNKRCVVQMFKPVDDIPRRCSDFSNYRDR